jgi:hypothetical protein
MRSPITPRRRRRPPAVIAGKREPATPEPASHILRPRPQDLGPGWAMHARRCRALLPPALAWAAPLLDPDQPRPVACAHAQARALLLWHHHLPNWAHVSIGCRHTGMHRRTPAPR